MSLLPDIILDRDGVINVDSPDYIKSPDEWQPISGSIEAIVALKKAGFRVFVATNQSGVGRGYYSLGALDQMHQKMHDLLSQSHVALDGVYFCPHLPEAQCSCRKPLPGMLLQIASEHRVVPANTYYVGDSSKDLEAASAAGMQGILVLTGNGIQTQATTQGQSIPTYTNLKTFSDSLFKGALNG